MAEAGSGIRGWLQAIRRNHGVEHATVSVLFARVGPRRIAGRAAADGFFILGSVDEALLLSCAREALERMRAGEADLAVSPFCGTNIVVTAALTTLAAARALSRPSTRSTRDRLGDAFTGSIFAVAGAQPVGRLLQQYLTTSADVGAMEIVGVRSYAPGVRKVLTRGAR